MVRPGGKLKPGRRVHIAPGFDVEIVEITERRTRIVRLAHRTARERGDRAARAHPAAAVHRARRRSGGRRAVSDRVRARERAPWRRRPRACTSRRDCSRALDARRGAARRRRAARRRGDVQARRGRRSGRAPDARGVVSSVSADSGSRARRSARTAADASGPWAPRACARSRARLDATARSRAARGETRIFIRPPYTFRGVDRLVTNFHLPRSTLIMLVAALRRIRSDDARVPGSDRRGVSVLLLRRRDGDRADPAAGRCMTL